MAWQYPVDKYKLGTPFGVVDALHPRGHRGTDYNGFKAGTPLRAVSDGKIVLNTSSKVLGHVIVLKVGLQYFGYCHMSEASVLPVGTAVKCGDAIGKAGTTGLSTGVHLHLTRGLNKNSVFAGKVFDAHSYITKMIGKNN